MGHLRMPSAMVSFRGGAAQNMRRDDSYLFTLSRWHAMAYIGRGSTLVEYRQVDPNRSFPRYVMAAIDYAVARGIDVYVMEYKDQLGDDTSVGVIMSLYAGPREIGNYAVRLGFREHQQPPADMLQ